MHYLELLALGQQRGVVQRVGGQQMFKLGRLRGIEMHALGVDQHGLAQDRLVHQLAQPVGAEDPGVDGFLGYPANDPLGGAWVDGPGRSLPRRRDFQVEPAAPWSSL